METSTTGNVYIDLALTNTASCDVDLQEIKKITGPGLTKLVLHHPDLELDEAVSIEAVVLPHAAVTDLMATQIQLAERTKMSDFRVTDCVLLQNVDQAPKGQTGHEVTYPAPIFCHLFSARTLNASV